MLHLNVASSTAAPPIPSEEDLDGMPTLIIDDNATNRSILSEITRQWKMKPHMCDTGESGLAELSRADSREVLIACFCSMNRCPGWMERKCSIAFGETRRLQAAVIMMLTANDQVKSAARCRQLGAETYLIKPISPSDLLASIRLAIGVHGPASTVNLPVAVISPSSLSLKIL